MNKNDIAYETKYFPVVDINDSGTRKAALIPTLSSTQFTVAGKPHLEEIIPHIFHLHGTVAKPEIGCPRCGARMSHYTTNQNVRVYICTHCL